jgi:hypothetical protein
MRWPVVDYRRASIIEKLGVEDFIGWLSIYVEGSAGDLPSDAARSVRPQ